MALVEHPRPVTHAEDTEGANILYGVDGERTHPDGALRLKPRAPVTISA